MSTPHVEERSSQPGAAPPSPARAVPESAARTGMRLQRLLGPQATRVERSVTVRRSREEVYGFFRDVENLPCCTKHVDRVTAEGARSRWVARGGKGETSTWELERVEERPGELLRFRSVAPPEVRIEAAVWFTDAPAGRGTEVRVIVEHEPGHVPLVQRVLRLIGQGLDGEVADALRRVKQWLEAGEIATVKGQTHGRRTHEIEEE